MPETINGYVIEGEWTNCANGDFAFASKMGKKYFLKRLPSPKYPVKKADFTPKSYDRLVKYCSEYEKNRAAIIKDLQKVAKGCPSLVVPCDFFRTGPSYYLASERITDRILKTDEISALDDVKKKSIILQYAQALSALATVKIVHGDLKPSNVFVCSTSDGIKLKILDFDDCYYSGHPPEPEATIGSMEYYSPELGTYICSEDPGMGHIVTCSSDIFAAGIMIHEYVCGKKPTMKCKYAFQADKDSDITIYNRMGPAYKELIEDMLRIKKEARMDAVELQIAVGDLIAGRKHIRPTWRDKFFPSGSSKPSPDSRKGPLLQRNADGTYLYIGADGSHAILSRDMAEKVARIKKISIKDDVPVDKTKEDVKTVTEPHAEKGSGKAEVISRTGSSVTVRMPDGSTTTMPLDIYEAMKKKGKL